MFRNQQVTSSSLVAGSTRTAPSPSPHTPRSVDPLRPLQDMAHVFRDEFRETRRRRRDRRHVPARVRFHGDVPPPSRVGRRDGDRDPPVEGDHATHLANGVLNRSDDGGIVDTLDADADAWIGA